MIDQTKLQEFLELYKQKFDSHWENEKFKWEAVKTFQDNWDIDSKDFTEMLKRSISKTSNFLTAANYYAKRMIELFAEVAPEQTRSMFRMLFDESGDISDRIIKFRDDSELIREKYTPGSKSHYQDAFAASAYLWLRYPDKYYIYKFSVVKAAVERLGCNYKFKKGAYVENYKNNNSFLDELCEYVCSDTELIGIFESYLTDDCYSDPAHKTLTFDVEFFIGRYLDDDEINSGKNTGQSTTNEIDQEWFPDNYSPKISTDTWTELLKDPQVFTTGSLEIMKRLKDYGGQATCSQLAAKYGESANFYSNGSVSLARRVAKKTGCPLLQNDTDNSKWWPILYLGKYADKQDEGVYIWKLRDELASALDQIDFANIQLYHTELDSENTERRYWWLNTNPKMWDLSSLAVGDTRYYTLYNENGNKRRIFQNFLDAKAGDLVIGYVGTPIKQIVAICKVSAEQDGEKILFEKIENLTSPVDYSVLKNSPELKDMEVFINPTGSLFRLTKDEFSFIMDIVREENPTLPEKAIEKYSKKDFLDEVFMSENQYDRMVAVLRHKKNIILQGAPGVGKTFAARRLAYAMMGEKDEDRIKFVQFHQNYTYEDFVMGYKPTEDGGFQLKRGIFYQFCKKAENQPGKDFFFIIDEINRGNMSKIFGELLMLIENDYRGKGKVNLSYNDELFSVPENLYIIGMMNTADRSLAMIDYALRRRFSFFEINPAFESEDFKKYQAGLDNDTFDRLIDKVKDLNRKITDDPSLGKGFCIGHSYFSNWEKEECTEEKMQETVDYEIIPMLEEYWFDDNKELQRWSDELHGVFQ